MRVVLGLVFILIFTGCGTAIKNVSTYKEVPLEKAQFMPSKELIKGGDIPKVIILDLNDKASLTASQANLGTSMAGEIESQLSKGKSVNILKRVTNTSIDEEMKLAELSDAVGGDELGSANYIISGKITNATFRHEFQEKRVSRSGIKPAKYFYFTEVRGFVKIYELPSLNAVATLDFEDNKMREDQASTSFLGLGKTSTKTLVKRDDAMVRAAGADAMNTLRIPLKNFFAKKGYVYEQRSSGSETIVKVTLGSLNGAKEGEEVKFYTFEESINPFTDEKTKERIEIGKGTISNQVRPDSSWIVINEVYENKKVRMGDFIMIEHQGDLSDLMNTAGKKLNKSGLMKYKDRLIDFALEKASE